MTYLAAAALAAVALLGTSFAAGTLAPVRLSTEIEIAAAPEAVWDILADVSAYPDWNPFIRSITGPLVVGEVLETRIAIGDKAPATFAPRVLVAETGHELRWLGTAGLRGVFDGEHAFELHALPTGGTRLVHAETFTGVLAHPLMWIIGGDTERGFHAMNSALKARAEARG